MNNKIHKKSKIKRTNKIFINLFIMKVICYIYSLISVFFFFEKKKIFKILRFPLFLEMDNLNNIRFNLKSFYN